MGSLATHCRKDLSRDYNGNKVTLGEIDGVASLVTDPAHANLTPLQSHLLNSRFQEAKLTHKGKKNVNFERVIQYNAFIS